MVEDMYKEEIGDTEINSNSSSENLHKGQDDVQSSENPHQDLRNNGGLTNSSTSNMNSAKAAPAYQPEAAAENNCVNLKMATMRDDSSFLQDALLHNDASGRFVAYQMDELSSYGTGNRVSLTLGLQNCDSSLPSFAGVQGQDIYNVAAPIVGIANTTQYDYLSIRDRQPQFSSPHPLHDFVACKVRYT